MHQLLDELLLEVFDWLHLKDLQNVALLSRRYSRLTRSKRIHAIRLNRNLPEVIAAFKSSSFSLVFVKELILDFPRLFDVKPFEQGLFTNAIFSKPPPYRLFDLDFANMVPHFENLSTIAWTSRKYLEEEGLLQSLAAAKSNEITSFSVDYR